MTKIAARGLIPQVGFDHSPIFFRGAELRVRDVFVLKRAGAHVVIPVALQDQDVFDVRDIQAQ